ncbi:MAG: PIN domain-containing protein [Thiolinea sp.]
MRKVLLDANLLIGALDEQGATSPAERDAARQVLASLLKDETVTLVITPLIRYEVLRGIIWQDQARFDQLKRVLDGLTELDVNRGVSELAANLFRFDRSEGNGGQRNIEKRKFDVFHFASARYHGLELVSQDSDMTAIGSLFDHYEQAGGS